MATTIQDVARQACSKHSVAQDAIKCAWDILMANDGALVKELYDPIVQTAVRCAIYKQRGVVAAKLKASVSASIAAPTNGVPASLMKPRGIEAIEAASRVCESAILDLSIGEKRLRDWTGTELLPIAEENRRQAAGHSARARLFFRLAELAGDRVIGDAVGDEKANEIWRGITNKDAGGHETCDTHGESAGRTEQGERRAVGEAAPTASTPALAKKKSTGKASRTTTPTSDAPPRTPKKRRPVAA